MIVYAVMEEGDDGNNVLIAICTTEERAEEIIAAQDAKLQSLFFIEPWKTDQEKGNYAVNPVIDAAT